MKRDASFRSFLAAYPPIPGQTHPVDGVSLAEAIEERFGISVPAALQLFWLRVGAGSFGGGEIYIFGDAGSGLPGPEVLEWNAAPWWRSVYSPPKQGGPFFFGQTPFGDQLGFRWQGTVALPELFMPDTMEVFLLGRDLDELLGELLVAPGALCDSERLARAAKQCGPIPPGQHYAPDVSPLRGGTDESFHVATAEAHMTTAISGWEAIQARTRTAGTISVRVGSKQG
ncbi:MAG: SMI1/KNR4 family protein [Candidatus Limnocylindrales bacterium]|jgi:hypothetical protein